MATLSHVVDGSLCRACSGRMVAETADGERLQECPKDEERQAECLANMLFRLSCLDEAFRYFASGRLDGKPELNDILEFWAQNALGPDADPKRLCFRDVLLRPR